MSKTPGRMTEREIVSMVAARMKKANWDPAFIYAFKKTGMLVAEGNKKGWSEADLKEWDDAVSEYRRKHP